MPPETPSDEEEVERRPEPTFDLAKDPISSFSELEELRGGIFARRKTVDRYRSQVDALGRDGDAGRRRGLGHWLLGEYEEAAELLASHESDDVASFTRATALLSIGSATFEKAGRAAIEARTPSIPRHA